MNRDLKALYIDVLKHNWKIDSYRKEPNGDVVVFTRFYSTPRNYNYSISYRLTPTAQRTVK